jgi:hypothetical protein
MDFQGAKKYIVELLREHLPATLTYHNFKHTLSVIEAVQDMAKAENVTERTNWRY